MPPITLFFADTSLTVDGELLTLFTPNQVQAGENWIKKAMIRVSPALIEQVKRRAESPALLKRAMEKHRHQYLLVVPSTFSAPNQEYARYFGYLIRLINYHLPLWLARKVAEYATFGLRKWRSHPPSAPGEDRFVPLQLSERSR